MTSVNVRGSGSLINSILRQSSDPEAPLLGLGCTILGYTDRNPATIVKVSNNGATIWIKSNSFKGTPGTNNSQTESQSYIIDQLRPDQFNEVGATAYTLRKNGKYVRKGEPIYTGTTLLLGERQVYRDPHF